MSIPNIPTVMLDNDFLSNIFSGGTQSGLNILNALNSENNIVITNGVLQEATFDTSYPKDLAIQQWVNNPDNGVTVVDTPTGDQMVAGTYTGSNGGEISITEAYNMPQFADVNVSILSNDASFFGSGGAGASYGSSVSDVQTTLGNLLQSGDIQAIDYMTVANNSGLSGWMSQAQVDAIGLNNNGVDASVDPSGTGVSISPDGNPSHAIDVTTSSIDPTASDVGGVVGQTGAPAAATDQAFANAAAHSGGGLDAGTAIGLAAIGLFVDNAIVTAGDQYANGNYAGGSQTLAAAEANLALGVVGATVGSMVGLDIAGGLAAAGVVSAGSPLAAAAAGVGALAVGASLGNLGNSTQVQAAFASTFSSTNTLIGVAMANAENFFASLLNQVETPAVMGQLNAVGAWMSSHLMPTWVTAMNTGSPLVLDLSSGGTGLTLSAENGTGAVLWDYGNGLLHQSGFVSGTTGLLCIDPNGGPITQADLFGNEPVNGIANGMQFANGFQDLQTFAGTTGVLDSSNSIWNELYVWVPSVNQNAVTTPGAGTLYTLAELGITSINLDYSNVGYQINGNNIEEQSTFVINGNTQTIADAWFSYEPTNTIYDGTYELNPEALLLPDQRGYGNLPELYISMSMDSTLLSEVQNLASQSFSQLMDPSFGLENAIKTILYEWAGVENVDPTSQGAHVNALNLAFIEQLMGENLWNYASGIDYNLGGGSGALPYVTESWDIALGYLSAHILAQAGFNALMGNPTYDPVSDALYVNGNPYDAAVQFADQAGGGTTLEHLATNDFFVLFPGDAQVAGPYNSPGLYIQETANGGGTNTLVLGVAPAGVALSTDQNGDLLVQYTATDTVEIQASMLYNSHDALGYGGSTVGEYIQQIVFNDGTVESLTGGLYLTATANQGEIYGTSVGGDTLDGSQITGAVLRGTVGTETFIAGPESTMIAGDGTNIYVINAGSCPASSGGAFIDPNPYSTGDTILLHDVTPSQVSAYDNTSGELVLSTANGDQVQINGSFSANGINPGIAQVDYDNGDVWNLTGVVTFDGSPQYDMYGFTSGTNFVADGNAHNFYGYSTNDIFSFTPGSAPASAGGDAIIENAALGSQTIAFHDILPSAVTIADNTGGNLIFSFGTDQVTLGGGSYSNSEGVTSIGNVEQATFDNGTVWNLQGALPLTATENYQALYGLENGGCTLTADGYDNYLYAFGGPVTLVAGDDANLYNGTGSDTDVFNVGFGTAIVYLNSASGASAVIDFHDVTASQLAISDSTNGNLYIADSSGDIATLSGAGSFNWSTGFTAGNVPDIVLDNGDTINLASGLDLTATGNYQGLYGTESGGCTLTADGYGDYLYGFGGSETLIAGPDATLYNGTGSDTDVFNVGFGTATVDTNSASGASAVIDFHDVTASQLAIYDSTNGSLYIADSSGDVATISGGSFNWSAGFTPGNVQDIVLDNGNTINLASGLDLTATGNYQALYGAESGGCTLTADGTGDYLYAFGGTVNLVAGNGADLYNGTGSDTDTFNVGFGTATVDTNSASGASATIAFHGVTAGELSVYDSTNGNLYIADSSGDVATISGGSFNWSTGFTVGNVQEIALDSGADINLTGALNLTATGNSQLLLGTGHGDTMTALGSGDYLYGIAGNNTMTGAANQTTYEYGGSGSDTFVDGGGTATNEWTGGTGADTYIINSTQSTTDIWGFSESKGDVLNIANILSGDDVLANPGAYIQETQSGNTTQFSIDPTGSGNFSYGPQIILHGVTGLESVSAMIADAHLVVHS